MPRLILALVLVGLVPQLMVLMDRGFIRRSLQNQVIQTLSLGARSTAERVAGFVGEHRVLAEALANNPTVYSDPSSPESSELLAGVLQSQPDLLALSLANLQGEEYLRAQRREWATVADRVLAGPSDEMLSFHSLPDGIWIRLDLPMRGGAGVVRQVVSGERLAEILSPLEIVGKPGSAGSSGEWSGLEVFLSSTAGNLSLRGDIAEAGDSESLDPDKTPAKLVDAGTLDHLPTGLVEKAMTGRISGTAGEDKVTLGAYSPVRGVPWVIVTAQPRADAEAVAERMKRDSWLALVGAMALTGLLAAAAYGSVVKPIRRLVRNQRDLVGLSRESRSGGEIEQLEESFSILERRIHDQEALGKVFLGRYEVLEMIGEGGMGTVFRGWDPKLQRPVALKTIRLDGAGDVEARRHQVSTLLHEAVAAARITHPNVAAVYDVLDQGDVAFLSMELVAGVSLAEYLGRFRQLLPGEVVSLGLEIAKGLGAAHEQGVVHHDVKPGNVLLGWNGEVKVVDFGIARFVSSLQETPEKIFGTPGYLAPEALRGDGCGAASDLFSLGVILYECLTGTRPFKAQSLRQIVVHTLRHEPLPPRELNPSIPEGFQAIILQLLRKDPEERLTPSSALVQRLEALPRTPWRLKGFAQNDVSQKVDSPRSRFLRTVARDRVA